MTERQERVTAGRVHDVLDAESQAHLINRLGGWRGFRASLPSRITVVSGSGLWSTKRRSVTAREQKMLDARAAETA